MFLQLPHMSRLSCSSSSKPAFRVEILVVAHSIKSLEVSQRVSNPAPCEPDRCRRLAYPRVGHLNDPVSSSRTTLNSASSPIPGSAEESMKRRALLDHFLNSMRGWLRLYSNEMAL